MGSLGISSRSPQDFSRVCLKAAVSELPQGNCHSAVLQKSFMGGLRGGDLPLSTDEKWQEAGEGLQVLSGLHGHCAGFPSSEQKREALLLTGAHSHTFRLRSDALLPHGDSANEERPCHTRSD